MRRSSAISQVLLLLAFYFVPLASPFATPACCRRNGVHHCAMQEQSPGETSFSSAVHCPYRFPAIVLTHATKLFLGPASVATAPPGFHEFLLHENADYVLEQAAATPGSRGPPYLTL